MATTPLHRVGKCRRRSLISLLPRQLPGHILPAHTLLAEPRRIPMKIPLRQQTVLAVAGEHLDRAEAPMSEGKEKMS